jgi:hypothetical protein
MKPTARTPSWPAHCFEQRKGADALRHKTPSGPRKDRRNRIPRPPEQSKRQPRGVRTMWAEPGPLRQESPPPPMRESATPGHWQGSGAARPGRHRQASPDGKGLNTSPLLGRAGSRARPGPCRPVPAGGRSKQPPSQHRKCTTWPELERLLRTVQELGRPRVLSLHGGGETAAPSTDAGKESSVVTHMPQRADHYSRRRLCSGQPREVKRSTPLD